MPRTAGQPRVPHIVLAITGASGIAYGVRLLEALHKLGCESSLILSEDAIKLLRIETGLGPQDIRKLSSRFYSNRQMEAPMASGSRSFDAMVICPCTMSTA